MEPKQILAIIAALLALVSYIPYLIAVFKKQLQPHPYTWLIWSIVVGITLAGQVTSGAGAGALPTLISEMLIICVFLFSLQFGFKHVKRIDNLYLAAALIGIIPWIITRDPTISVVIAVSIDLTAFIPTIRKIWRDPRSESSVFFTTNAVKHVFGTLSLQSYNIATALMPVTMIFASFSMAVIILWRRAKHPKKKRLKKRQPYSQLWN